MSDDTPDALKARAALIAALHEFAASMKAYCSAIDDLRDHLARERVTELAAMADVITGRVH